ncbi:MAG: ThiF family adenylyltransferase [Candidatus Norongarragalinales archaeon]
MGVDEDVFDRQKRIAGWNQDKVSNARLLVVGCGALGNEVVKLLMQLGANDVTVVDHDTIVKANLNRCVFFTEKDAEEKALKAEVLAREAKTINQNANVKAVTKMIELAEESFFGKFDFAFGCLDNLAARMHLNAQAYGKMPFIDGGINGFNGRVQTIRAPSPCLECGFGKADYKLLWKKYSCVGETLDFLDPKMPALSTSASITASLQVNEFLKLLHGVGETLEGKFLFYDGLKGEFKTLEIGKKKGCAVH